MSIIKFSVNADERYIRGLHSILMVVATYFYTEQVMICVSMRLDCTLFIGLHIFQNKMIMSLYIHKEIQLIPEL